MEQTIFYSWQSDTEPRIGRYLIRDALKEALSAESGRLELDEATRGEAGSPDIFSAILRKISGAHLFIADLTLVGSYRESKSTPNPNVLIEYGFALSRLGPERIIPVMNSSYGGPEDLPFDLRARAIRVKFAASPTEDGESLRRLRRELAGRLRSEIQLALDESIWNGISEPSRTAVELFVGQSEDGAFRKPEFDFDEFCELLDLSESEAREVVDELEGLNLLGRRSVLGNSLKSVYPENRLFWIYDRVFRGWDVQGDALMLAQRLVDGPRAEGNQLVSARLAQELGWSPRRLNPALTLLVENGIVRHSETSSYPYAVYSILDQPETRRFVREASKR